MCDIYSDILGQIKVSRLKLWPHLRRLSSVDRKIYQFAKMDHFCSKTIQAVKATAIKQSLASRVFLFLTLCMKYEAQKLLEADTILSSFHATRKITNYAPREITFTIM